ncbi:hypothetical protein LTR53_006926 [Teratosphaeriaceae sp. CCFEE 6253]|nr:hypothetical protein LTR53_006926 [Teratosphaeriaceae sp. CCFEE 6253]
MSNLQMPDMQKLNTRPTGFFDLPAELRNIIYDHALKDSTVLRPVNGIDQLASLPLLAADPRIRAEAEQMHFMSSSFHFELGEDDIHEGSPAASRWLYNLAHTDAGGFGVRHLRSLTISHGTRFSLTLGHERVDGRPTLRVKDLTMTALLPWEQEGVPVDPDSHNVGRARRSIHRALKKMYLDPQLDLGSYSEHNLIGGLAQFLIHVSGLFRWNFDNGYEGALEFVTGGARWKKGNYRVRSAKRDFAEGHDG